MNVVGGRARGSSRKPPGSGVGWDFCLFEPFGISENQIAGQEQTPPSLSRTAVGRNLQETGKWLEQSPDPTLGRGVSHRTRGKRAGAKAMPTPVCVESQSEA